MNVETVPSSLGQLEDALRGLPLQAAERLGEQRPHALHDARRQLAPHPVERGAARPFSNRETVRLRRQGRAEHRAEHRAPPAHRLWMGSSAKWSASLPSP